MTLLAAFDPLRAGRSSVFLACLALSSPQLCAQHGGDLVQGPHPVPVDEFHPDETHPSPAYGGEAVVHLAGSLNGLNAALDGSAAATWIRHEVHDQLLFTDWESWEDRPSLALSFQEEDQLILQPEAAAKYAQAVTVGPEDNRRTILYGLVLQGPEGYRVTGSSPKGLLQAGESLQVALEDVQSLERGTVTTYTLPDDRRWHDGHLFDAQDVLFSWEIYQNPHVSAARARTQYEQILVGEAVDATTIRFVFERQYFQARRVPGELCILPRHLYDLNDPDNRSYDPETHARFEALHGSNHEFSVEELGTYINDNPHNTAWVGLGPYRIVQWEDRAIVAERFEDYHDPANGGYLDRIVWRNIPDDNTAFNALINGELDYFDRVKSEDYFFGATESAAFTENFYKGHAYTGIYSFTAMNMWRPKLADLEVRKALDMAFNWERFLRTQYNNLGIRVSGPFNYFGPGYNRELELLPHDPELAKLTLSEAGWYDRDGDDVIDKDGVPMELDYLYQSGNLASQAFGLRLQQELEPLGVKIQLSELEWGAFIQRLVGRNFDLANLGWSPVLESDPDSLWHSRQGAPEVRGKNVSGVVDGEIDRLIAKGQQELEPALRGKIWQAIHRRLHEDIHPYLFGINTPRKFAMNKRLRGLQSFRIAPGYAIRRWYYGAGTPGTRATRAK